MRTIEGVSAKGNSPGFESPKQCLCTRLKVRCNGGTKERDGSTMVWNGREELLPLVVGSIGLSAQGSSSRVNPIQGYILVQLTPKQQSIRFDKTPIVGKATQRTNGCSISERSYQLHSSRSSNLYAFNIQRVREHTVSHNCKSFYKIHIKFQITYP